ncbi:MAG: hypothetical protein KME19_16470 [Microcoleus vaginatus WJT46-NPBG5]|nr:hypothetical protein [Microcoleus vaginatus WJT46-NPBG5]
MELLGEESVRFGKKTPHPTQLRSIEIIDLPAILLRLLWQIKCEGNREPVMPMPALYSG